jgi:alpha-tubulin suppressor-like RCC1 family protein/formylglycine-generating enzyme required for sulfatase activity
MFMREFFDAGVAPARGLILARSRAVARWAKAVWLICLLASLLPSVYAQTTTRGFGSGTNQFTMDFVTIGNPNNPADTTGTPNPVGSVAYTYNLGKYEVSREQIDKANTAGGLGITMSDMSSYGGNGVNKPATGVTWHEAAKFVNWLNTSTGGTAAYKFVSGTLQPWSPTDAGYNASNLFRNSQAKYVIASRDEWYKGAYGSPNGTWYNYPTGSDSRPSAVASGAAANTAVYDGQTGPADINNAGGLSAYGTMGQGGNVWEWNETAHDGVYNTVGESLEMRGGSWDIGSDYLPASYRNYYVDPAIDGNNSYGFRVAVVSDFNSTINNGEVTITGYTGTGGVVEIPTMIGGLPVTQIGTEAFKNITSITNMTLPNGVTAIGQKAFEGCTQLISISIPNSVATIGQFAFAGCSSLTSITLPTSLTLLDNYLFAGCGALSEIVIPNGVTTIGSNAFESCANLVSVTLPSSVTLIKSGAFFNCPKLAAITIPSAVATIEGNAFLNSSTLASVYFIGNTPPTIGVNAFSGIASGAVGYYPATASVAWGSVTVAGLTVTPFGQVNRAPVITGQSTTYDALAEFIDGPTLQSANSRWQYLGGNASTLALLGNWKTTGNEVIQNQPQWDGNSGYLNNYPFVQRINSSTGPVPAGSLVIHPSDMEEANRAVAIGWKNTSVQTVAVNFHVNLRLPPYGSNDGIDYKLQRGLAGSSRYLLIRSGLLENGGSVALASDGLLEMRPGEMLYLIVDSKNNFYADHTEVSAFTVTVFEGVNLDSISGGTVPASNPGTAVTVLTAAYSDADSGALKGIAITGVDTSHGIWEYTLNGGSVWNSLSGVNIASARLLKSDELHRVRFIPNASFSGNAEIQYRAWDQTSGEDGALADLTEAGGGAWVLVAYGANASLGGFLTGPSGSFSSSARTGSAVLPGSLDILKNSMELAMTWTASGGSLPSGGIGSYTHGIAFALPNAAGMSFDGSATSPLIYNNGANPLNSSFAVGSSNPDQSLVNVRTLVGSPGMPSQMYLRNKTFGAGYGSVYGLVMNDGSNAQLDYNQVPDSQTFKAVYLDHGTGAAQGQGLVMGGSGGASNSYVPSTMALWARLDPLQVLALNGGNPVSTSGNYLLDGISTSYVDVIDFDASGAFSAETATGTIRVLDTSVPVITLIGANPLEIYKGATFSDPGATVTDNVDTTRTITGSGTVNTATVGNYTLNYNATDAAGNLAVPVTRTVVVKSIPATITLSTASGSYTLLQGAVPLDDSLTVSGDETFSGATIQIETGFAFGDTLNLTPSIGGITGTYDGTKGILTLSGSGSASAYQSALRAVTFSTTSTSTAARGFKVTLGSAISFGGHYYEFVPGSHSWAGARTLALSKTFNGLSGYLANLTSADENSFVKTKIGTDVWIGGSDEGTEGVWKWMDGPEAGITFWNGLSTGSAPSGRYANWNSGEPNDAGNEDYAQFFVSTGKWNDLPSGSRLGFLVEYGTDTLAIQTFSSTRIFSVTKATPSITAAPTAAPIAYGQTLGSSTLSGGSASVSGTFAFTTPSTAPSVGTATQSVTFRPSDTANYNTVTTSVSVTVSRATPAINPGLSASAIAFGQTLSSSSLSGSASLNGTVVGGTFAFTTPSTAPNAGTASQNVTFTPTETANYNTVTTNVSVTVSRATPTINLGLSASAIVFGQTLANSSLSGSASVNGTVVAGTFAFTTPSTAPNVGTAGQGVTFTPIDRANYNTVTASVSVTVNQALVSSGFSHTLYLGAGATTVTAWGLNTDGRLGVGDMNSPVNWAKAVQGIPVGVTVDGLAAGGTHSLILAGGQVYAAGSDRFGQLGQGAVNGANKTSFTPVVVPSSTPVAVAAGGNHSLIVTASGKVFACGDNTYGQLARSSTTVSSGTLVEVNFPGLSTKIVSVVAGADHNLAVDEDGGVWVWGRNNYGQLGKGNRSVAERTPSELNLGDGVFAESVAAGFSHSLILTTDGEVLGFGRNNSGQTGQVATTSVVTAPLPIYKGLIELSEIRSISAGTDSSFAITESGQLYSWGYNAYGELLLGYASPVSSPAVYGPKPSPICTNVSNVSGGGYSSLAVGAQGVIFGGRNDVGQSGNGPDPEQVVGDYFYEAGDLTLGNLTMDLAGTTETLYDQIFVGNGAVTLNGILNLMFVGTYTGPVYGSTQTFDLIWAKNGIVLGTGYEMAFNQAGYLVESVVADKSVEGVSGKVLQATIRAVVTAADLAKAVDLARPSLDGVESVSYGGSTGVGIRTLSLSPGVEMIYSYERPTGGVISGAEYFVDGFTYRVEQVSSLTGAWGDALVSGTTVTPVGNGYERATLRISSSGGAGFLRLQVENPQANGINAGVGSAITY